MKYKLLRFSLLSVLVMLFGGLAFAQDAGGSLITDELTLTTFGVSGTNYTSASDVTATSSAVYAAQMAGGNSAIQLRSNSSNSGIVTTASGGTVKSIKVEWNSATADARTLDVYGKGDAYSAPTELYSSETQGTKIASFVKSDGTKEITIDGSYAFIGFRSNSGAMYIDKITIVWENNTTDNRVATTVSFAEGYATTGVVGTTLDLPEVSVTAGETAINVIPVWSSSDETVATISDGKINLLAIGSTTIKASFEGDNDNKPSSASFTLTVTAAPYTSIAAMLADITSTKTTVTYQFEDLLVTYVNGSNTYVSDGTNGFLFYGSELGLTAGDKITGTVVGQLYAYNGLPEMALTADGINVQVASSNNEVTWSHIAPADIQNYINKLAIIQDAVYVGPGSGKNLTFKVGDEEFAVYNNWSVNVDELTADKTYVLLGAGAVYAKNETTTYQLYLSSFAEQVAPEQYVYRDFAVNLTNAEAIPTTSTSFGVKVAEDGTYTTVAADDATANFIVNANSFNGAQHGWVNCVFTVPVQGAVKIELGDCQYGGQNGTIVDAAGNSTEIKANASKACWDANAPHDKVVVAYYAGTEPTTLTITYNGYCPFIAVTSIDPKDIPSEATLTFIMEDETVSGTLPVAQKVAKGGKVTIPANTTLYKEGFTLIAWTDAVVTYKIGDEVTLNDDMSLTPVFTENTVSFADRTAETTLVWQFGEKNGAGALNAQGGKTILVTQATIGEAVIDVKMDIDASNGKINNVGRGDEWAQCNDGTILTIPAYKGTAVSFNSYGEGTGTTIGGADAENKAATYAGTAETLDIVAKGMSYIASVTAVYPVPAADEEKFVDIKADFTNGSFFAKDESGTYGLKMNEDGSFTRVAADDATANAVISGKYHSDEHGLSNFSATVKVLGTVKISMGTCAWGGDVTVKNAEGETVATFNTNTGACYHADKENNIAFGYYKVNEPTTLTISGGSYTPYFAVEAISPELIPNDVKFIYDIANAGAEGIAPEAEVVAIGKDYTLPKNFTLYKEGATLTGWSDGTNTYAPGETIKAPEAEEITLTPVFTENEVNLADRTEPVTVKFDFMRQDGAPTVGFQNQTGIWVAQATIGDKTIDVKADFDTNNGGKFANGNWTDWAQLNGGTKFTVPSCKGATVSMEAYGDITTTTIDGQTDYTSGKTISYEIAGAAETVDVVIGDGSYYRYIQVVLPVVQSQEPVGPFENVAGTVNWLVGNEVTPAISDNIKGGISASVNAGSGLTIATATYFETEMVHYTPQTSNAGNVEGVMIEYRVKPVKGVTFQPTQLDYAAVKVGTDNATYSWSYTVDGVESDITQIAAKADLLRNNGSNSSTAKLMHTETFTVNPCNEFTVRFYISACANNKNICIGNVTISGIVNGEPASVEMFSLATAVTPEDGGSVNVYPAAEQYEDGSEVTLTATENFGYDFVNWTNAAGDEVSTEAKFKYTVNADETLTANFKKVETYELALTIDGTNDYMVTVSPEPTVIDGKNMYEAGTTVELTANQYEGLVTFNNWSDGETNSSKLLKMEDNVTLTAIYEQADIIAGWDFYTTGGNGRKADFYAQDNDGDALNLMNTETGETQGWLDKSWLGAGGYESFKGAAVNWRTGTKNADVGNWHWQTKINAEAFTDINVQFQMLYNYNAYQTYNAEYSLDGENWTKFGSITMEGAKNAASFKEQLPAEANNQKDLFIRMIADKTSKVDGAESANDGNTLAMFFITGSPKLADDGVAPVLVSTVPADGATGASATGKIVLTFDERVKVAEGAMGMMAVNNGMSGAWRIEPVVSGKTVSFAYKGLEYGTQYKFQLAANTVGDLTDNMLAEDITINFTIMERPAIQKGTYDAVVENVDQLLAAITAAENRSDKNVRFRIFVKDGNYVIPVKENQLKSGAEMPDESGNRFQIPECITFIKSGNISFIGESRDGVIITNGIDKAETFAGKYGTTSKYDGIGNSDVFQISGSDYYFQDLTVETGMEDATGRDLAIQDKATRTIYKNTGLRGYQDTWTSNNDRGLYYFEGGYVRGRTDYMCGKGDAFFNGVELRQIAGGYAAVPSKPAKIGWVYKDCVINGEAATVNYATGETRSAKDVDGNYTLGRPWGSGTPVALFIDTKMNVVPSAVGWNEMSGGWPARFAEYNSMTSTGSVIDLSGRKKIFADTHENNPVLSADEALQYSDMSLMFGDWQPTLATEQAPIPTNVILTGSELTWDDSNYALLWAVCKDGKVIGFTVEPTFTITEDGKYTVRAANEMGGLSEASAVATVATGIKTVETAQPAADNSVYTLQGVRVDKARKGLYIINGRKVVIK